MTDYTELKSAIEYILSQGALEREFIEDADLLDAAWAVYEALGPTDILALIAENGRLQEAHEQICTNYNQASYASEERGKQIDQLRAENAGLRTGYEAYERVNAELKAEVEGLRDYLRLRVSAMPRDRLRETFNAAYYGPRELRSDGEQCRAGVIAVIDAALGQGVQS